MRGRQGRHLHALLAAAPLAAGRLIGSTAEAPPLVKPPEFTWREYAVFLLTIAAQIEHSLMVQYLYAAYSLGGPQVPPAHRDDVSAWRQIILGIAKEEMGHLATVQNALKFLGAPLALDREDYPWDSQLAPYPFVLERLTRHSLAKYIVAESPEKWPADVSPVQRKEIDDLTAGHGHKQVNRVGALYEALITLFQDEERLPNSAFHPETYPLQVGWDEVGRGYGQGARGSSIAGTAKTPDVIVPRVDSRANAVAALRAIAEQGESPGTEAAADEEASHFRRFLMVFQDFPSDGSWDPALPLATNPVGPGLPTTSNQTAIGDEKAGVWASLFNLRYRMLLSYLGHIYSPPGSSAIDHRNGVVINRMFGEMYNLRAIASVLVRFPAGPHSKEHAGPPFQMPYSLQLPDTDAAFWTLHLELIRASADLLGKARGFGGAQADYAASLASLDQAAAREMSLYAAAAQVRTGAHRMTEPVR